MTIWFTSDEHYSHLNVIRYCQRPFSSIDEMNETMIRLHNEVVSPGDEVWHLGDFSLRDEYVKQYLPRLNGIHHLICGNHDSCFPKHKGHNKARQFYLDCGFTSIQTQTTLNLESLGEVLLSHMPIRSVTEIEKYSEYRPTKEQVALTETNILIHGHIHEKWRRRDNMINVGVDVWDFRPVSEKQLVEFIKS